MLKQMTVVLVAVAGVIGVNGLSFSALSGEEKMHREIYQQVAHAEHKKEAGAEKAKAPAEGKKVEDAGNTVCPVSGEKIDETAKLTYEYKGKVYALCCQGCLEEFKKDPEKYIEKMEKGRSDSGTQEQSPHK
jgi:YHS domain-containing protein